MLPKRAIRHLVFAAPFLIVFVVLFWPTFTWMAERFDTHDSFYSHGWLIPFASGWLVWQRRARLSRLTPRASVWGLALLIPAICVHVLASLWRVHFVSGFSMLAAIWGLGWTVWGGRVAWALRFPLLFLLFMIPLPGVLLIAISFKMKLAAAWLASSGLTLLGLPAQQAGSMIHVRGISVIVDDTCSGLRSLISLIALSTLWTSLMPPEAKPWHKLFIVLSSIPIALAANMIRIIVLVLLSAIYGAKIAESFIHYGSGVVVFGVALAVFAWLSRRLSPPPQAAT